MAVVRKPLKQIDTRGPIPSWWVFATFRYEPFKHYLKIAGLAPVGDMLDVHIRSYVFSPNTLAVGKWVGCPAYNAFANTARELNNTSEIFRRRNIIGVRSLSFSPKPPTSDLTSSFNIPVKSDPRWCEKYGVDQTTALFLNTMLPMGLNHSGLSAYYTQHTRDWLDYAWSTVSMLCMADDLLKRVAFSINTTKMAQPTFAGFGKDYLNKIDHRSFILSALRPELTEHIFPRIVGVSNEEIASIVPVSAITKRLTKAQLTLLLRVFDGALLLRDIPCDDYEPYIHLGA